MPTQRPSKGGPIPEGSRTGGLITMSGRRTEVNKHQIRWSLTKTHKDLSTRYWLLERACEPDQVPARPGPGLIPGLWNRAFKSAELSPAIPGIGPDTLGSIARALILGGEYLGAIDVENGGLRLLQAYSWDVTGGADPQSWHYSLELPGPSGNETRSPSGGRRSTFPLLDLAEYPLEGAGAVPVCELDRCIAGQTSRRRWPLKRARRPDTFCRSRRMLLRPR